MAEEKAARLRETAASFRAQAAELEAKREQERRHSADRSFNTFDSNNNGTVDVAELKAGLEVPLQRSFTKQLTARMGRKPSREEVSEVKLKSAVLGLWSMCKGFFSFSSRSYRHRSSPRSDPYVTSV